MLKPSGEATESKATMKFKDFLPHALFAYYYTSDQRRFSKLFTGGLDAAKRKGFWQEMLRRQDPRLVNHAMINRRGWDTNALPLSLHGDDVPVLQIGKAGTK